MQKSLLPPQIYALPMDVWAEFMNFLNQYSADPFAYGFIFFIYSVAAAVVLPIPVEIGLILNPGTPFIFKALILGSGKAVGSILVFYIGFKVEGRVRGWSQKWKFAKWFVEKCTRFVEKTGYFGLYILLSIPGMVDTIPVYIFSLFNREGRVLEVRYFALANFLGGITRAFILFALFYIGGINLFGSLS
ncbi:MAG: VTT domain-containing protein [Methanomassiliicoccales archaeon]|nr:VTT domain-containing protein [Methanomassiliicoccales archaeon]